MGESFFATVRIAKPRLLCMASLTCTHCALGLAGAWSYNRERGSPGPRAIVDRERGSLGPHAERGGRPTPSTPPPATGLLNDHFIARRNVVYERAKFNNRRQELEEPVESFITALYTLTQHCGYDTLDDEMTRDRIVVGIQDRKLLKKLQLDPTLTLDKAIATVRQVEAVKRQQSIIRGDRQEEELVKECPPQAVSRGPDQPQGLLPTEDKLQSASGVAKLWPTRGDVLQKVPPATDVQDLDIFRESAMHPHMQARSIWTENKMKTGTQNASLRK